MLTAVFGPVGARIVSVPRAPTKTPVPVTTGIDTAPAPAAVSLPLTVIVPPGSLATVSRRALLALVSLIVPRSEPTTAPFFFPNWACAFRSRLVNIWRSPALAFRGGRSTLDSDVVIEMSWITAGGAAAAPGAETVRTIVAAASAAGTTCRNTIAP